MPLPAHMMAAPERSTYYSGASPKAAARREIDLTCASGSSCSAKSFQGHPALARLEAALSA
jgi:hypothetical protein